MRFFGHPAHPAIVHFPLASWVLAAAADAAHLLTADAFWIRAALWLQGVGLAAAALAVVAGASDLRELKTKPQAATAAMLHIVLTALAFGAVAYSFLTRVNTPLTGPAPEMSAAVAASFIAAALVLAGAYFGGALVYGHGFGRRKTER